MRYGSNVLKSCGAALGDCLTERYLYPACCVWTPSPSCILNTSQNWWRCSDRQNLLRVCNIVIKVFVISSDNVSLSSLRHNIASTWIFSYLSVSTRNVSFLVYYFFLETRATRKSGPARDFLSRDIFGATSLPLESNLTRPEAVLLELTHHEQAREGTWTPWKRLSFLISDIYVVWKKKKHVVAIDRSLHPVFTCFPHIASVKSAKLFSNSQGDSETPRSSISSWLSKSLYFEICQSGKFLDTWMTS